MDDMVSLQQSHEVVAKLQTKANWLVIPAKVGQAIVEDPDIGREFTKYLLNRGRIQMISTDGIIPPQGGKILIVTVLVNESRPWRNAVGAAGPDTGRDWSIWKMGNQYPPVVGAAPRLEQVFLANFGKYTRSEGNLIWAKEQRLIPASPRVVFAVAEYCPYINLAMDPMTVVSLEKCFFEGEQCVAVVRWNRSKRKASQDWFGRVLYEYNWFAFLRE